MGTSFTLVVSGDTIMNHRASVSEDREFGKVVELLRGTDVVHTQLEMLLHDYDGPETYPAAEGAWSWMRAPTAIAEELKWCGIDLVSTPNNHTLDYSYGGLRQTWAALDAAGIVHAGTGRDLAEARRPGFLDTAHGRVALVSACSSFPTWARAGASRADMQGRPGVNPLRFFHRVDRETADAIVELSRKLGLWVTAVGDEFVVNPPGLHNTLWRYRVSDEPGVSTIPDEDDLAGNLQAIRHARSQADFVIAHLHTHEWDLDDGRICTSPAFAETYARAAVDAGAQVVIAQGSHAPMRGIEVYRGRPIFYDPGDLFRLGRADKQPADFYLRWGYGPEARFPDAGPHDAYRAREAVFGWGAGARDLIKSPREIYSHDPGFFIPVCHVGEGFRIARVTLRPAVWLAGPKSGAGLPAFAEADRAAEILERVAELSAPYGTEITIDGDVGTIEIPEGSDAVEHAATVGDERG
jgi:poly-gamma-glutamate synthesis protein (capsule biosynthesis protein)